MPGTVLLPICALVIHSLQSLKLLLSLLHRGEGAGAVPVVMMSAPSEGRCRGAALGSTAGSGRAADCWVAEQPCCVCVPSRALRHTATCGEWHSEAGALLHKLVLQARAADRDGYSGNARRAFSTILYPCESGTDSGLQIRKGSSPKKFMSSSLPYYIENGSLHTQHLYIRECFFVKCAFSGIDQPQGREGTVLRDKGCPGVWGLLLLAH